MQTLAQVSIASIALAHLYTLWIAMFAWETRAEKYLRRFAAQSIYIYKKISCKSGIYNGFLLAGLIWTFFINIFLAKKMSHEMSQLIDYK